jgi:hypothetical protein
METFLEETAKTNKRIMTQVEGLSDPWLQQENRTMKIKLAERTGDCNERALLIETLKFDLFRSELKVKSSVDRLEKLD